MTVIAIRVESTKVQNSVRQGLCYKDIFIQLGETPQLLKSSGTGAPWRRKEAKEPQNEWQCYIKSLKDKGSMQSMTYFKLYKYNSLFI